MGLLAKREGDPPEAGAAVPARGDGQRAPGAGAPERSFDALDPDAAPPRREHRLRWARWAAVAVLAAALSLLAVDRGVGLPALIPLALLGAGIILLTRGPRSGSPGAGPGRSRRGLRLGGDRLTYQARGAAAPILLLELDKPFGVTLLSSPRRDRVVALLSSSAGAFFIGAAFDAASRRAFASVVERATIVATDEVGLDAIGPDGEALQLAPETFSALMEALTSRAPGCLERFFLTDARGAPLCLDERELRAGGRSFDLGAPIEWRAFVFQEAIGHAVALYQGTWARQGTSEIVLVCLLPAITPTPAGEGVVLSSLDRRAIRDLRLMQGAPEDPPAPPLRVAMDRLLMLPIRSALDKAPRPAAQPPRARA